MLLNVEFDDRIVEYFDDYSKMQKHCGFEITKAVKKRINQLSAAQNFSDYLRTGLGHPHLLTENLKGMCAVTVIGNLRLLLELPTSDLSPESLRMVDTILIKGVMDYHGTKNESIIP